MPISKDKSKIDLYNRGARTKFWKTARKPLIHKIWVLRRESQTDYKATVSQGICDIIPSFKMLNGSESNLNVSKDLMKLKVSLGLKLKGN